MNWRPDLDPLTKLQRSIHLPGVPVAGECILTREQIKEISRGVDPEFLLANEPEVE